MRKRKLRLGKTLRDCFEEKYIPEPMSGCWLWTAATNGGRYGKIRPDTGERKNLLAHRVAWELYRGPIPAGLYVCHKCDNILCVNPDHLFLGTSRDNRQDMVRKQRGGFRGCRNPKCKLTEASVRSIRLMWAGGRSVGDLAASYCVNKATISNIVSGRTWSHLT